MIISTGTWTPVIQDGETFIDKSQAYTSRGTYTRVGDHVFIEGSLAISSMGTLATNGYIGGLPIPAVVAAANAAVGTISFGQGLNLNLTASTPPAGITGYIIEGTSVIKLLEWDLTGGTSPLTIAEISSSSSLTFCGQYTAA